MFEALLGRFGLPEAVFDGSVDELCAIPRLTSIIADAVRETDLDAINAELTALEQEGITVHTFDEITYPSNLKSIPTPPPILFELGEFSNADAKAIAIIGTRKPSINGVNTARKLASGFAQRGFTIVSGLALGIDTTAHRSALEARGRTIAVLGSGIKIIHPRQNQNLAEQIRHSGAIFSELKPNAPPKAGTLMSRDRIISGLTLAVIVVEASDRSGSMNTAKQARKQGRRLFTVDNEFTGNQQLIAEGACSIAEITEASLDRIGEIIEKNGNGDVL